MTGVVNLVLANMSPKCHKIPFHFFGPDSVACGQYVWISQQINVKNLP